MENLISIIEKVKSIITSLSLIHNYTNDLNRYIQLLTDKRVNFVVTGEFSSGKSSLINTIINCNILPTADLPMTSKQVDIYHSESPTIKCYLSTKANKKTIKSINQTITLLEETINRNKSYSSKIVWECDYTNFSYFPSKIENIQNFLFNIDSSPLAHSSTDQESCNKNSKGFGNLLGILFKHIKEFLFSWCTKTKLEKKFHLIVSLIIKN